MDWTRYSEKFFKQVESSKYSVKKAGKLLEYAYNLYDKGLPIIFDQTHLSLLIGIDDEYLHRMTNAPEKFYRTFYIPKKNGKKRRIDEPLNDLKMVQKWILNNILYCTKCSKYSKAYIKGLSLKDNTRFHKRQDIVMTIDIKDFFPSINSGRILNLFIKLGYSVPVSVMLTYLCCYNNCLPQGAPTSAYLSNLILKDFDDVMGLFCQDHKIRYTRYADDMTFSGSFNIGQLIKKTSHDLIYYGLTINYKKLHIMRKGSRQSVTGIIVNEKQQVNKEYRQKIRQEVYYISKYGIDSHLSTINEKRASYIEHLIGKINYCLYINPNDKKMQDYLNKISSLKQSN